MEICKVTIKRRDLITGSLAAAAMGLSPAASANPFVQFLFRIFLTNGIRRGIAGAAGRGIAKRGARDLARRQVRRNALAKIPGRRAGKLSRVRTPNGVKTVKDVDKFSVRKEILREAALSAGFSFIMPSELGLDTDNIIGVSQARASEMLRHNAIALWVSDETNKITLRGHNLLDTAIADYLTIGLMDAETGSLVHPETTAIIAEPNAEFDVDPFEYKDVPLGPKFIEAFLADSGAPVTFQPKKATIIVVAPDEVVKLG